MGLFDIFKKWALGSESDRILTPQQIEEMLADDYGDASGVVVFVYDQSGKQIYPSDLAFLPFINAQFSHDPKLGMIYGTGSGCALVRKTALEEVQVIHRRGKQHISSCQDFMDALQRLGFTVKQDPKLDLDLLP